MPPPSRCAPWRHWRTSSATARSASPTSRTWSCRTCSKRDLFALWNVLEDAGLATPNSNLISDIIACPGHGLLRAGDRALDPDRAGDQQPVRRTRAAGEDRRAEDQDLRLHQRLRPSPCRPYRHPRPRQAGRRNSTRSPSAAVPTTRPRSARSSARASRPSRCRTRSSGSSRPISSCAANDDEPFIDVYRRAGEQPFKEKLYAAA